jgi:hypothetical protein
MVTVRRDVFLLIFIHRRLGLAITAIHVKRVHQLVHSFLRVDSIVGHDLWLRLRKTELFRNSLFSWSLIPHHRSDRNFVVSRWVLSLGRTRVLELIGCLLRRRHGLHHNSFFFAGLFHLGGLSHVLLLVRGK